MKEPLAGGKERFHVQESQRSNPVKKDSEFQSQISRDPVSKVPENNGINEVIP
jgi:hypothetical protein